MPWFTCDVLRAGPAEDGTVFVWLKDHGGSFDCWFYATVSMRREMLATALAAISTGFPVEASVVNTTEYSELQRLYVLRQ